MEKEESNKINNDLNNLIPWNSKEFPVKINSIRYNQDNTLFTLATSRGYKIFSTKNLKQAYEETAKIRELDDLEIVMTYYCTSLVFFIPTKNNKQIIANPTQTHKNSRRNKSRRLFFMRQRSTSISHCHWRPQHWKTSI